MIGPANLQEKISRPWTIKKDGQTARPLNYEIEGRLLCIKRMRRRFPEAKIRFLN
jgi:hypothetical protein